MTDVVAEIKALLSDVLSQNSVKWTTNNTSHELGLRDITIRAEQTGDGTSQMNIARGADRVMGTVGAVTLYLSQPIGSSPFALVDAIQRALLRTSTEDVDILNVTVGRITAESGVSVAPIRVNWQTTKDLT